MRETTMEHATEEEVGGELMETLLEVAYEHSPAEAPVYYYRDGSGYPGAPEEISAYRFVEVVTLPSGRLVRWREREDLLAVYRRGGAFADEVDEAIAEEVREEAEGAYWSRADYEYERARDEGMEAFR